MDIIPVNPIVSPRPGPVDRQGRVVRPNWQSSICEVAGGVTKSNGTYYLLYHCLGNGDYSAGVSTALHPLGPWSPTAAAPILPHGPCLNILEDPAGPAAGLGTTSRDTRTVRRSIWPTHRPPSARGRDGHWTCRL